VKTPIIVVHVDLAAESIEHHYDVVAGRVRPCHGLRLFLWRGELPLGDLVLTAAGWPVSRARFRQLVAQAIAPAVGQRLFGVGFHPAVPERRPSLVPLPAPPLSALTALVNPLDRLTDLDSSGTNNGAARVSLVVCGQSRPAQLRRALAAVQALKPAPDEVVLVDNASNASKASSASTARELVADYPGIRYVHEARPGLSVARNRGLRETSGDIIAFTDADAEVLPTWLGWLIAALEAPEIMAVTGLLLPASLDTEHQLVFRNHLGGLGRSYRSQRFDSAFFRGMRRYGGRVWRIGTDSNMAVRRQAMELIGGFDERLAAGTHRPNGRSELWSVLLAQGWCCYYEPAAVAMALPSSLTSP